MQHYCNKLNLTVINAG